MKNNKKIISEINRVNELMGNKKLLSEGTFVDELISTLVKLGTKETDEIVVALSKLTDEGLTVAQKADALDDVIRLARKNGDDDIIKAVNKALIDNSEGLISRLDNIIDNNVDVFSAGLDRGATKDDLLRMTIDDFVPGTGDEVLDEFIKRQLRKKAGNTIDELIGAADDISSSTTKAGDDVTSTRITDDPSAPKTGDDAAKSGDEVVDDVVDDTTKLTDEEVEEALDELEATPWGEVESIDEETAKYILDSYQGGSFGRWIRGDFRSATEVLEDRVKNALELSKYYTEGATPALKAQIEEQLKKDLYDMAVNFKKASSETQSQLTDIINSFEKDARGNIINPNERRFAEYIGKLGDETDNFKNVEKMMGLTPEGKRGISILGDAFRGSTSGTKLWSTTRNIGKSVNNLRKSLIGREMDKATAETAEKIAQDRGKTWKWLTSGSPRGNPVWKRNQKNYLEIIESGGLSAAKKSYALELVFRLIQWKVAFGLLYTFRNFLSYATVGTERREMINKCLSSQNKEVDCADVDTWIESWALDFMEGSDESKMRWLKDFADQTFGNEWGDEVTDYFPGKLDDALQFAYTFFDKSADDETMADLEDNFEDGVDSAQQGAEQTQEEIEQRLEDEGIEVPGGQTGSSEITNTLDGLSIQMGYPKDAMSPQTYNGTGEIEIWGMKFVYNSTDKKFEQK